MVRERLKTDLVTCAYEDVYACLCMCMLCFSVCACINARVCVRVLVAVLACYIAAAPKMLMVGVAVQSPLTSQ